MEEYNLILLILNEFSSLKLLDKKLLLIELFVNKPSIF
jgi:hypothetical protein